MKLSELIPSTTAGEDIAFARMVDDSRTLEEGDLFVWDTAIAPALTDEVIADARAKGAAGVVTNAAVEGAMKVDEPGRLLAAYAVQTWPRQPQVMLAVTGTSGKTSAAWFGQQLMAACGVKGAAIGTLGTVRESKVLAYSGYTSPTALQLHPMLQGLADDGVTHGMMEVSSHALSLHRADGVRFKAAGITNVTQDHFDFHGGFEEYFAAKARLFSEVLPDDGTAVVNILRPELLPLAALCKQRGLSLLSVGTANAELVVEVEEATAQGLQLKLKFDSTPVAVQVPLVGAFQAENLAVSLGLLVAGGLPWQQLAASVKTLTSVPGRMEIIPATAGRPTVVVDYAHKPDALERALLALKPLAAKSGGRVVCVFGCGGDRDAAKRPLMGKIAAGLADSVIVTNDNPRNEDAAAIRAQVIAGAEEAAAVRDIGDRRQAIAAAVEEAVAGDIVLVAGKGHEDGQIVKGETLPFDDRAVVREVLA